MFEAAGYPASKDGKSYVPFTPGEKKVIVFKVQAEWGGAFEMFYATENRRSAQAGYSLTQVYGGDSEFFGERVWQYIIFEANESTPGWAERFNDGFRLDYTNYVEAGDTFLIGAIAAAGKAVTVSADGLVVISPAAIEDGNILTTLYRALM